MEIVCPGSVMECSLVSTCNHGLVRFAPSLYYIITVLHYLLLLIQCLLWSVKLLQRVTVRSMLSGASFTLEGWISPPSASATLLDKVTQIPPTLVLWWSWTVPLHPSPILWLGSCMFLQCKQIILKVQSRQCVRRWS